MDWTNPQPPGASGVGGGGRAGSHPPLWGHSRQGLEKEGVNTGEDRTLRSGRRDGPAMNRLLPVPLCSSPTQPCLPPLSSGHLRRPWPPLALLIGHICTCRGTLSGTAVREDFQNPSAHLQLKLVPHLGLGYSEQNTAPQSMSTWNL